MNKIKTKEKRKILNSYGKLGSDQPYSPGGSAYVRGQQYGWRTRIRVKIANDAYCWLYYLMLETVQELEETTDEQN